MLRGMSSQREKAEELLRLHQAPEPLVLVNAWDAASAKVVAAAPGARAIATASWSIAAARGYPDGEAISREEMIDGVRIVANAVELPVTADLERGFGDARMTLEMAIEAGAVGCNLEDSDGKRRAVAGRGARGGRRRRAGGGRRGGRPDRHQRPHRRLAVEDDPGRGAHRRRARARRRVPGGGRGLHLRALRPRPGDDRDAGQGDGRPDQRDRRRRRADAGRVRPRRRRPRQLRPGPAGRGDGGAIARGRDAARGRRPARGPGVPRC